MDQFMSSLMIMINWYIETICLKMFQHLRERVRLDLPLRAGLLGPLFLSLAVTRGVADMLPTARRLVTRQYTARTSALPSG